MMPIYIWYNTSITPKARAKTLRRQGWYKEEKIIKLKRLYKCTSMHVQLEKLKKIHQFIHCEKNIKEEKDKK